MHAKPDDVGGVGEKKRRQARHEQVSRQHQEDVTRHRQNEGNHEPRATVGVARIERSSDADQCDNHRRFADVLDALVAARHGEPIPDGERSGDDEKRPGSGGQRRLVVFFAARRAGAAFLAVVRLRVVAWEARPPWSTCLQPSPTSR